MTYGLLLIRAGRSWIPQPTKCTRRSVAEVLHELRVRAERVRRDREQNALRIARRGAYGVLGRRLAFGPAQESAGADHVRATLALGRELEHSLLLNRVAKLLLRGRRYRVPR